MSGGLLAGTKENSGVSQLFHLIKANGALLGNAASLIGSTGITSALGFVYWWLAARQFSLAAVGFASAAISAMTLFGTFSILGLGTLLVGELPRHRDQAKPLISTTLMTVGGVGLVLGVVVAIGAPFITNSLQSLGASAQNVLIFALGVSFTAITLVLDQALIGLLRGSLQLWRNALFALIKLVALYLLSYWASMATGLNVYSTWTIGNALSLLILVCIALVKGFRPDRRILPQFQLLRNLGPDAIKHHALNLTLQAPAMLLPLVVTVALSATANAWFYISWNLSSIGNTVAVSLTIALYAVSAAQPQVLARKMRLTLGVAFAACLLINIVFLFGTRQVLELFGHSYADGASWSLRILSIESFPYIIKAHYIALSRIRGRVAPTALITVATGLLELGGSALGVHLGGLTGLGLGWLAAMCVEVALMSPKVYKAAFGSSVSVRRARTREELFAEDLDILSASGDYDPIWKTDTVIQPIWSADTLLLSAIVVRTKVDENAVDQLPTLPAIHLVNMPRTPVPVPAGNTADGMHLKKYLNGAEAGGWEDGGRGPSSSRTSKPLEDQPTVIMVAQNEKNT